MDQITFNHPRLGPVRCLQDSSSHVIKILGLPYATIPQRFARSVLLDTLCDPNVPEHSSNSIFDATTPGSTSIQPYGSVHSDASNIPLPTFNLPTDEPQSEHCLNLSIYLPSSLLDRSNNIFNSDAKLPVLIFLHGGAFFLGSGTRPYYSPISLLTHAITRGTPFIFIAVNYRLGALGFFHSPHTDTLPPNNGLCDQDRAMEWVRKNIEGFGGDVGNISVLGQSAGAESVALRIGGGWDSVQRGLVLSGSCVVMPAMTGDEHHSNILSQAAKLGIRTKEDDGGERNTEAIAKDLITIDIDKIRNLSWVGLPCTLTPHIPVPHPTMRHLRTGTWPTSPSSKPFSSLLVSTTTYDGSISFAMLSSSTSRHHHAATFLSIATSVLGPTHASTLCDIYNISPDLADADALQRICQFESDIGFFAAALSIAQSGLVRDTYLQVFDLTDFFDGPLKQQQQGDFATHTFDVVMLLGGVSEDMLPERYIEVVGAWRDRVVDFVVGGKAPCERFEVGRRALWVGEHGVREVGEEVYLKDDGGSRRESLFGLAAEVAGEDGWDVLWESVCRRFLMEGK